MMRVHFLCFWKVFNEFITSFVVSFRCFSVELLSFLLPSFEVVHCRRRTKEVHKSDPSFHRHNSGGKKYVLKNKQNQNCHVVQCA